MLDMLNGKNKATCFSGTPITQTPKLPGLLCTPEFYR